MLFVVVVCLIVEMCVGCEMMMYYIVFFIVVGLVLVVWLLLWFCWGLVFIVICDSELVVVSLGVKICWVKFMVYVGMVMGIVFIGVFIFL